MGMTKNIICDFFESAIYEIPESWKIIYDWQICGLQENSWIWNYHLLQRFLYL